MLLTLSSFLKADDKQNEGVACGYQPRVDKHGITLKASDYDGATVISGGAFVSQNFGIGSD